MRTTFNYEFYCRRQKVNRNGDCPLELSLSVNGTRSFITLPSKIPYSDWTKKKRPAYLSELLDGYRRKIYEAQAYLISEGTLSVQGIKEYLRTGGTVKQYLLSDLRREWLKVQSGRWTNGEIGYTIYRKLELVSMRLIEVIGDKEASSVLPMDIETFYSNLKRQYKPQTSASMMTRLKSMFIWGHRNGKIQTIAMFNGIRISKGDVNVSTIDDAELERIISKDFGVDRVQRVADLFVFCCGSGLSYCDAMALSKEDIQCVDGLFFIEGKRKKTGVPFFSVLLPCAVSIMNKYGGDMSQLRMSNQRLNSYLKEVQDLCHITSVPSLHVHLARHKYATSLLNSGHSLEIVAKCLGHSNTRITTHYAKMMKSTVLQAFK